MKKTTDMFLAKVKNSKVKDGAKMISNVISISCRLDRIKAALQERLKCYVPDSRTTVVTPDIIKNLEGLLISMEDCIRLKKAALDLLACTTSLPYQERREPSQREPENGSSCGQRYSSECGEPGRNEGNS